MMTTRKSRIRITQKTLIFKSQLKCFEHYSTVYSFFFFFSFFLFTFKIVWFIFLFYLDFYIIVFYVWQLSTPYYLVGWGNDYSYQLNKNRNKKGDKENRETTWCARNHFCRIYRNRFWLFSRLLVSIKWWQIFDELFFNTIWRQNCLTRSSTVVQ